MINNSIYPNNTNKSNNTNKQNTINDENNATGSKKQIDKKGTNNLGIQNQSNYNYFKKVFKDDIDFISREIDIFNGKSKIKVMYIDGLVENQIVNDYAVMELQSSNRDDIGDISSNELLYIIEFRLLSVTKVYRISEKPRLVSEILRGSAILMLPDNETALVINAVKSEHGEVSQIEATLTSGNEAFSDNVNKNFVLLRKRLPTPKLKFRNFRVGRLSQTNVRVA